VIRSDAFSHKTTQKLLGDAQVILCTLSMIAGNKRMHAAGFPNFVPVNTLVIDEASQIQVHDYLPVLSRYWKTIRKMCFIGDDKQCGSSFFYMNTFYKLMENLSTSSWC
jgi:superfamily I DNA and/or RNA helicase